MSIMAPTADFEKQDLVIAVQKGNLEDVRQITRFFDDSSLVAWREGYGLLAYYAVGYGFSEIAKLLVKYGCPIYDEDEGHILTSAVKYEDLDFIKLLFDKSHSLNPEECIDLKDLLSSFSERSPVDKECERILDYLISEGADINDPIQDRLTIIHCAAESGNSEMISLLASKKALIDAKMQNGMTPLHVAASSKEPEAVRVLLELKAKADEPDNKRRTPFSRALETGHMPTIQEFLNHFSRSGNEAQTYLSLIEVDPTLIYFATWGGNKSIVEMLLLKGVNPNMYYCQKTPLLIAVKKGFVEIVRLLVTHKADLNAETLPQPDDSISIFRGFQPDSVGFTALHYAAEKKHEEILKLLLNHGAKPDVLSEFGSSPIHFAAKHGSLSMVTALLDSGCSLSSIISPESSNGYTVLHYAVESGNEEIVALLLRMGISVNPVEKEGFIPLYLAAQSGNKKIVELLLKFTGISSKDSISTETPMAYSDKPEDSEIKIISEDCRRVEEKMKDCYIAMYLAAYNGHEDIVKIFLDLGINPNADFEDYLSPLHAACQIGSENIVKLLFDHGADVNPKGIKPRFSTPLITATFFGHEGIVELLLNRGAEVNAKLGMKINKEMFDVTSKIDWLLKYGKECKYFDFETEKEGYSSIHCAVRVDNKSIIELLINHGADLNAKAEDDETPLEIAVENGHEEIVDRLLKAKVDVTNNVIFAAIKSKKLTLLELLSNFVDPSIFASNSFLQKGYSLLQDAIWLGNVDIVDFLLKKGCCIDSIDSNCTYDLPLHCAIAGSNEDIVSKLIEHNANVNSYCRVTPLFHAVECGKIGISKMLIKNGARLEHKSKDGLSLLHYIICRQLDEQLVQFLLECGADVNEICQDCSPIKKLISCRNIKHLNLVETGNNVRESTADYDDEDLAMKLLLEYESVVSVPERPNENSLLASACRTQEYLGGIKLLLQYDTDVNALDFNGRVPFDNIVFSASKTYFNEDSTDYEKLDLYNSHYDDYLNYEQFQETVSRSDYDEMLEKSFTTRKIARLMTQAMARMEAAGKNLNAQNVSLLESKFVKRYYLHCKKEIEKMKQTLISGCVKYFHLLVADDNKLMGYARNANIEDAMEFLDCRKLFPLYGEDLEIRFKRGVAKRNLYQLSLNFLNEVLRIKLPLIIVHHIFSYLSSKDLRNLCRIHDPFIFVSTKGDVNLSRCHWR